MLQPVVLKVAVPEAALCTDAHGQSRHGWQVCWCCMCPAVASMRWLVLPRQTIRAAAGLLQELQVHGMAGCGVHLTGVPVCMMNSCQPGEASQGWARCSAPSCRSMHVLRLSLLHICDVVA